MKIFNDFDSEGKQKEYKFVSDKFWEENVMLVERSIAYWIMKWIIPGTIVWLIWSFFLCI